MSLTFCVGLTGGVGSGKSTVAQLFQNLGIVIADADQIAHDLTQAQGKALPLIQQKLGSAFILQNGNLNRALLRETIFSHPSFKKKLEAILHPEIEKELLSTVENAASPYVIMDVPLLFESPLLKKRCQRVLVVDCTQETQMQRVLKRNGWDEKTILSVIRSQTPRSARLKLADDIIENEGDYESLFLKVKEKHAFYLENASKFLNLLKK